MQLLAFASITLLLLPALQKVAVGFLVFLYCFVHNLAQLRSSKLFLVPYTFCWRRKWQSTAVFLPGKSYGWRSLTGYSPWSHKELDTTERVTHTHTHTHTHTYFLCLLLLEETFVQVQALQQRAPGPSLFQLRPHCASWRMAYLGTCAQTTFLSPRDDSSSRRHSPSQITMFTVQKLCQLKPIIYLLIYSVIIFLLGF